MSETKPPEVGKVYWVRRVIRGMKYNPFKAEILNVTPNIIEYRENSRERQGDRPRCRSWW